MPIMEIVSEHDCLVPTPVTLPKPERLPIRLREQSTGLVLPAQDHRDGLMVVVPSLKAKEVRRFHVEPAGAQRVRMRTKAEGATVLSISTPEGHFTTYNFSSEVARPYFYPVLGPGGAMVTRSYPMKDVPGEAKDHPHHRSFWSAYGEVNGVDDWSETPNKHGFIRHQGFEAVTDGPVWAGFTAKSQWQHPDGKPLLDEVRSIRVYDAGPEIRLLDYEIRLIAKYGDLHYGDTKEGGILAFRVATTMDGNKGGRLENSSGGVGEKQVWGKRANWLDYSGPVDGQIYGIGMMDHPSNWEHPCYWHARDYGLVGTNSFAKAAFEKGLSAEGHRQKAGETLRFRYRVLIHKGDAKQGHIDRAYHTWIQPPTARLL